MAFFPFEQLDTISPRPLLVIAGSKADTLFWSREVYEKAKEPKELHVVDGARTSTCTTARNSWGRPS